MDDWPSDLVLLDEQVGIGAVARVAEPDGRRDGGGRRSAVGETRRCGGDQSGRMTCRITVTST